MNSNIPRALLLSLFILSLFQSASAVCAYNYRYQDNGDGTSTNLTYGLMWQRCPIGYAFLSESNSCDRVSSTEYPWDEALQQADILNTNGGFAGYTNWRVPNRIELASIYEGGCSNSFLLDKAYLIGYWSSTPFTDITSLGIAGTEKAWIERQYGDRTENHYVRFVRSVE